MDFDYHYNIDLPDNLPTILNQDFWVMENIGPEMFASLHEPVKFSATTWIIVTAGSFTADINLINYTLEAPALLMIEKSQIMFPKYVSTDFQASVIVISRRYRDNLLLFMNNIPLYSLMSRHPVVKVPDEIMPEIKRFFNDISSTLADKKHPYQSQILLFQLAEFVFKTIYKCFEPYTKEIVSNQSRMVDQFLQLAQQNFKKERFLDYYAQKLEVTSKHLSRTMKSQTGFTATEWIERFVILEAKVLLKSSNLNIQQISDQLNFPSQSFFGKYFKKITGMSPKEFRNSK